jgi:hypothetical protein
MSECFRNPCRFPKNVEGPFYTTGSQGKDGYWCSNCLWCGAPEAEAPELLAELNETNSDTYFVRQPSTPEEFAKAISACLVCCTAALRYGGKDREIIHKLGNDPEMCDFIVSRSGNLQCVVGADGKLRPFTQKIVRKSRRQSHNDTKKWWQFWR